ncbi:tail fiber domain-containing protein, partial [Escherichia coli]
ANYTHRFYPDGRTHSAQYTGITQKMGWDAPNYWGNALVWGETVLNNDGGWAPGLSWATQSTGGYPIRATWGLIPQGNNAWPLCSLRLRGDGSMFCNFQFSPSTNDITTWSSSGNFIFQKAANSDRDIKHDIIYTDGKDSYDRVMQWLPTMFKYNGSEIQRYGMIAQDLLKIDREYVKIIPGGDIFAEVIGLDDDGNEYVDREIVVDKADDTLALDNNVIMADMACAMVYMGNRMEEMRKELDEIKKILSK